MFPIDQTFSQPNPTGRANDIGDTPTSPVERKNSGEDRKIETKNTTTTTAASQVARFARPLILNEDVVTSSKRCTDVSANVAKRRQTDACRDQFYK